MKDLGETAFPLKFVNANFSYRDVIVSGADNYQGNYSLPEILRRFTTQDDVKRLQSSERLHLPLPQQTRGIGQNTQVRERLCSRSQDGGQETQCS
jgi:hypothetical protein